MPVGPILRLLIWLLPLVLVACTADDAEDDIGFERPATAVDYTVELTGVTNERALRLMEQALEVYRKQEDGAQSIAFLRRRAQGDIATAQKILRSFGYYEAVVDIDVDSATDPGTEQSTSPPAEGEPLPQAVVRFMVDEKRQYTLADHDILLINTGPGTRPAPPDAAALGSPVGQPARASRILGAENQAVLDLRAFGRPYATRTDRDAVADPDVAEIEVTTTIDAGRAYVFGGVTYQGNLTVDREYLETYRTFDAGQTVDPEALTAFQRALASTGLFNAASVNLPQDPPEGAIAPVEVVLEEAPAQTISGGVRFDTDVGPAVRGGYEHRNLFGANETLSLEALVGLEEQSLDSRYRVPQYGRSGQDLVLGLELRRIKDEAFEEIGGTFAAGLEREITPELTIGAGGLLELSRLADIDGTKTSRLVGLPVFVAYDSTDDRLDPSKGIKSRISATPLTGVVGGTPAAFAILDGTLSTYFDILGDRKYIFAARGRLASALAGDEDIVSANRRLFSGGGGSVRGYAERFIGPLDAEGEPTGGLSAIELGGELRARVSSTIGVAAFVEAGSVSNEVVPVFDEGVRVAVGGGVRYFSPIGPLRVDVGVPVNGRSVDDAFQVYISIGQAF
ncbi:MAG: BamA/TamA family outer membrane protein [Pseudomonadota bacterium]